MVQQNLSGERATGFALSVDGMNLMGKINESLERGCFDVVELLRIWNVLIGIV